MTMLVLSRKSEESVILAGNIEVKVLSVHGDQVSIGFDAPSNVSIYRKEIYDAIAAENRESALSGAEARAGAHEQVRANFAQRSSAD